jgi:hypothetical protein
MMLDAQDLARLMVDYARHLRPESIAIMTLKLRPKSAAHQITAFEFSWAYKIIRVRQ